MPRTIVAAKNVDQPTALTANPAAGPATTRGSAKRLDRSAYCVAEKRFSVSRRSRTEKAPVPIPDVPSSKPAAAYISEGFGALSHDSPR